MIKKSFYFLWLAVTVIFIFFLFPAKNIYAASLTGVSDTVSTSRPSASTPIVTDEETGGSPAPIGQVTIYDNKSVFLASDSAQLFADPAGGGETTDAGLNIASMSAAATPTSGQRIVYFTNTSTHNHHTGDVLLVPITAMHTINLIPQTTIPVGGKIIITFPTSVSSDTNQASPSANTFMFNGLSTSNIKVNFSTGSSGCTLAISGTSAGSAPTITCTITTAQVTGGGGTTVTFLVGCSSNTGTTCNTQVPTLINPTRTPTDSLAGAGVALTQADNWKINMQTQDNSSVVLDTGRAIVGTIESVQVQANIDPTLTFQIAGINSGTELSTTNYAGCPTHAGGLYDTADSGIDSSATFVNLGTVGTGINIAAQKITISTNAAGGYALTATSSGQLLDAQNGYAVHSSTTPGAMTAATELFGIHPCGNDVTNATWNTSGTEGVDNAHGGLVAWPTQTVAESLASHGTVASSDVTVIEYAITASTTTPAGLYSSVITYVATPTFN